uniref:Integrin alpha-2 domain-containing protein n=1 Tax=Sander lucioperca TaxID=283035 RepID=A0A8D0AIZ4_SANLU
MLYLLSFWHLQTLNVAAFNLDTQSVLQRNGDPGSLFGFSVAFHQQLLVGAPRSKHQNQVNVTGVVYQCDLTTSDHCHELYMFIFPEFLDSKGINNQWMGVRVTSQGPGKNVMVSETHPIQIIKQNLSNQEVISPSFPCRPVPIDTSSGVRVRAFMSLTW